MHRALNTTGIDYATLARAQLVALGMTPEEAKACVDRVIREELARRRAAARAEMKEE